MRSTSAFCSVFFLNATGTPPISTLSLHDALPISFDATSRRAAGNREHPSVPARDPVRGLARVPARACGLGARDPRSEEHTSELQSQSNLVCRLLLEKKNTENDRTAQSGKWTDRHP